MRIYFEPESKNRPMKNQTRIEYKYLLVVLFVCLGMLSGCKSRQNQEQLNYASVDFSVEHPEQNDDFLASISEDMNTVLIVAVPESTNSISSTTYLNDSYYARGLLDISSESIELSLPLNVSLRIAEATFTENLSLSDIVSNQPSASSTGLSDPITITGDDDIVTVLISLKARNAIYETAVYGTDIYSN